MRMQIMRQTRTKPVIMWALSDGTEFAIFGKIKLCIDVIQRERVKIYWKFAFCFLYHFTVSTAQYAHYVFNSIDRDSNGSVSFEVICDEDFISDTATFEIACRDGLRLMRAFALNHDFKMRINECSKFAGFILWKIWHRRLA